MCCFSFFKQENASEIFAEGEEIVSLAARNIEIVGNVAKTFVQTLDFSEMNGFSLTYDKVPSGNVFFTISGNITSLTVVEGVEELHSRRNSEATQKISKFAKLIYERRDLRYRNEIERVIDAEKFHFA